jgi:diguanylate cyclase (GGDEF)-like protein
MQQPEKNRRILIVDDMASIHDDVRAILTYSTSNDILSNLEHAVLGTSSSQSAAISYEIDSAYQGQDGLKLVESAVEEHRPYALAIVDVRMPPGWDGIQTIEHLRVIDSHLQIAICSAFSDYSWQSIFDKFGTNDWLLILRKPFDLGEIQQLACTMTEKWNLARQASLKMDELQSMVEEHARQLHIANGQLEEQNVSLADANRRLSSEIDARRHADARIRHVAFHDVLTDLPNRAFLMQRLDDCIERSKRQKDYAFAVLFTDIDDFKTVNDSLGHGAGDQLLSQIAVEMVASMRTMSDSIRPSIDTVARLGGDEFVVLLDDVKDAKNAASIADRLQQAVCKPLDISHRQISPSISIGVAVSQNDYDDPLDVLRDADTALYHAKSQGKRQVAVFDQAMRSRVLERVDIENDLKRAIEENQFVAYYQPIVSLTTGEVECYEALIRWHHPTRGLLSPGAFLNVAEQTGAIETIGEWMIEEVSRQVSEWQSLFPQGRHLAASLNLSACQLVSNTLVKQLDHCLGKYNLAPSSIKLELTETMMMHNIGMARKVANQIISRGIDIYLDDFGTGYSSLSILHELPFTAIKLDRSFVANMEKDVECQTTIQAVVMMAMNRNIRLIAEGVESYGQLVALRDLDCEFGQGYFFSRPIPNEELSSQLESGARYCVSGSEPAVEHLGPIEII